MDPRKRRALALQETSDNVSSVATPRTRVPGKTSKVPPNLAPLDAVLPEDMRLAHTSTTLELMQAHASRNETKKGDTRRQRDVQRWRDEAGEVRDALLLRDEAERSAKMRLVNEMGAVAVGGTDDDGTCDAPPRLRRTNRLPAPLATSGRPRSHSVEWVQAWGSAGAASATAESARGAQGGHARLARAAAKKKAEEKAAREAADPRRLLESPRPDKTRAGAGERVRRDARGRGGEAGRPRRRRRRPRDAPRAGTPRSTPTSCCTTNCTGAFPRAAEVRAKLRCCSCCAAAEAGRFWRRIPATIPAMIPVGRLRRFCASSSAGARRSASR